MMDFATFATAEQPIRASGIPQFMRCPMTYLMKHYGEEAGESGEAADTGSAIHFAAATWHKNGEDFRGALQAMKTGLNDYPFADLQKAAEHFLFYTKDERNKGASLVLAEEEIKVTLDPAEEDPTGQSIVILGHVDQVRRVDGVLILDDIKTGSRLRGPEMLAEYTFQLAAYVIGATTRLGEPVQRARIIRTQDYLARTTGPVFWNCSWSLRDAPRILDGFRKEVANVRKRALRIGPGVDCNWCPLRDVGNCVTRIPNQ